jgi:outer membrane receptor protein involved in Fe transport
MKQRTKQINVNAQGLAFPFLYNPSTATSRNASVSEPQREVQSVYASVELSYRDFLFLNLTDRNDWSSTLPPENNSYNYPSVNVSYLFTETFDIPAINFGKVRIGYSRVGGDALPFSTSLYYGTNGSINGQPIGNINNTLPNPTLEPLMVNEAEIGASLKLLNSRLFFDFAWYNKETINDIVPVTSSQTSGYDAAYLNIGKIENKGIELLIGGSPVKTENFTWNTTAFWANLFLR